MVPPQDIGGEPEAGEMGQHCSYQTRAQFSAPVPGSSQPAVIPVPEDLTPFWILPELHSRAHNSSPTLTLPTEPRTSSSHSGELTELHTGQRRACS